jgi:hypothetical protein
MSMMSTNIGRMRSRRGQVAVRRNHDVEAVVVGSVGVFAISEYGGMRSTFPLFFRLHRALSRLQCSPVCAAESASVRLSLRGVRGMRDQRVRYGGDSGSLRILTDALRLPFGIEAAAIAA